MIYCDTPDSPPLFASIRSIYVRYTAPSSSAYIPGESAKRNSTASPSQYHARSAPKAVAIMKRNLVIFVIIISLFSVIAIIGYLIYRLQSRVGFARPTASESEQSEA
ncbi:hypothetical protein IWX50DRAFT_653430 [Phyllosticta citricarpa]|uniref:Uncharacterized protein n=1 Tax=Phyllosticta citricarpa TaxID=55181 RepID=A0ABR1MCN0_9PEZI